MFDIATFRDPELRACEACLFTSSLVNGFCWGELYSVIYKQDAMIIGIPFSLMNSYECIYQKGYDNDEPGTAAMVAG